MQDELYGGARGRAPKGPTAKEKADELKDKIRNNDADFLEKYMQYGYEKTRLDKTVKIGNNYAKMLEIVRNHMDEKLRTSGYLGILYSEEVAKTVTMVQVKWWLRRHNDRLVKERKEDADRMERESRERRRRGRRKSRERRQRGIRGRCKRKRTQIEAKSGRPSRRRRSLRRRSRGPVVVLQPP